MKIQNYNNHIRSYTPHHFIFYPVVIGSAIVSGTFIYNRPDEWLMWLVFTGVFLLLGWLSFLTRQHYALMNQNRTARLELRLRYYILTQKRLEAFENKLSPGQLFALRFASDEELVALLNRAVSENLSPDQIKKSIKNWLPDHMRV